MLTKYELADLRAKAQAATPGPWYDNSTASASGYAISSLKNGEMVIHMDMVERLGEETR